MECSPELFPSVVGAGLLFCFMGDRQDGKNTSKTLEMENLSLEISSSRFSRDLLQRFMGSASQYDASKEEEVEEEEEEEVELNLGLSMGGRFGVDKSPKDLVRSSSIASCLPVVRDDIDNDVAPSPPAAYVALSRTSSLPVETEEAWRKRKELQTLRRMEAKRRRSEKQRNLRSEREGGAIGRSGSLSVEEKKEIEVNLRAKLEREKSLTALKRSGSSVAAQLGLPTWAAATSGQRSGSDVAAGKGKGSGGGGQGQGSVESKGGSSSSISELESKNLQGSSGEHSPSSIQSAAGSHEARENTKKAGGSDVSRGRGREAGKDDMPCVFTKGDGPNGRRVDGILYRYGKGEDVRIMCICHGSFHSPAEFVKHAGGTDIGNPLKHIVVNPNASSLV